MTRILGIDYGKKRCGLATTDPLQIIVTAVATIATEDIVDYLSNYCKREDVELIVIGRPQHKDGTDTYLVPEIEKFIKIFQKSFPTIPFEFADESFTSIEAKEIILMSGVKKSKRRDKSLVDRVSAVLILQRYLGHI